MKYQNVELHNVAEIIEEEGKKGFRISRLPADVRESINKGAKNNSFHGTGCEIRGILAPGGEAKIVIEALDDNVVPAVVSVYFGSFCHQTVGIRQEPKEIVIKEHPNTPELMKKITSEKKLPFASNLVRVRLPSIHPVRIISIEGDLSYPTEEATPEKTILCYGSSITHGASAIPPEGTYAAHCAHQIGYDLVNLGFGGSAHMDDAISEYIASGLDWDVATFEMGINVRQWPREKFHTAVENFVTKIYRENPDKYIFCIDLFTNDCDFMETPVGGVGFRETVEEIVKKIDSDKVIHIDGRKILTETSGLRTDLVHPSDLGMAEMGRNLANIIKKYCE
jgi:hypothetical protein